MQEGQLQGKVAIVTGATKGLGKGIAKRFLEEGARVVCAGRDPSEFEEMAARFGGTAVFHRTDVRDPESVQQLVQAAIDRFGTVDIMVANAGVNRDALLHKMTHEQWTDVIDTNLTGVFSCTKAVVQHMLDKGVGTIINVSSAAASRVNVGQANYCASKAAVEMFTRVSAIELGPKGIRVNCLSPGVFDEGMGTALRENEKIWNKYEKRMAMRRPGEINELAEAALFLASDRSSYVNGHIMEVNGGLLWG